MKQRTFFIDTDHISFVYPGKVSEFVEDLGVLKEHDGKRYSEEEIHEIVADLMKRRPYVYGGMVLKVVVKYRDPEEKAVGFYHHLEFRRFRDQYGPEYYRDKERLDKTVRFEHA